MTNLIYLSYDGIRNLVLSGPEKYNSMYSGIRYLISQKSGITIIIYHNFVKMKIDSYVYSPSGKTLTFTLTA